LSSGVNNSPVTAAGPDGRFLYFAYGSNLHPRRLAQRTPSCRTVGTAVLPGHVLRFHKRSRIGDDLSGKCSVLASGGDTDIVHGVVYSIEEADRAALDRAEGAGAGYRVVEFEVIVGERVCTVSSYQAHPDWIDDGLRPYDWYLALVVEGARIHRLPPAWVESLRKTPDWPDPDRQRAAGWLALARQGGRSKAPAKPVAG